MEIYMEEKMLSLCNNPPVKFFMHHSIALAMILAENKNWNFVLANYIQLNKSKDNEYLFDMYPRIGSAEKYGEYPLDNIIENHILTGTMFKISSDDIIEKVIQWIDNGFYVTINSDERMIPLTAGYKRKTFHNHPGFYFGYDLMNCTMKMLNFDNNMNYRIIDVSFKDLVKSFESKDLIDSLHKKGFDSYLIQLRKIKQEIIDYNYTDQKTIACIKQYLYEYLNGIDSNSRNLLSYQIISDNYWGIEVYNVLIACLQGKYSKRFLFQSICGLCEHKILMMKRFDFLIEKNFSIDEESILEYKQVVYFFEKLKQVTFKAIISNKYELLNNYISELNSIIKIETTVLEKIYKKLE